MWLVILYPGTNTYSETFSQELKNILNARISFFQRNFVPTHLNGATLSINKESYIIAWLKGKVINENQFSTLLSEFMCYAQQSIRVENGGMEGAPESTHEAPAADTPIISTKYSDVKEAVIDNEMRFLVNKHDVNRISECMIEAARDIEMIT